MGNEEEGDDDSGEDYNPSKAKAPSKKSKGKKGKATAKGRGRPKKNGSTPAKKPAAKKKESKYTYIEDYEMSTSESELDAGAISDDSGDGNWKPHGVSRVKKKKVVYREYESEDSDPGWKPYKAKKKPAKSSKVTVGDLPPK